MQSCYIVYSVKDQETILQSWAKQANNNLELLEQIEYISAYYSLTGEERSELILRRELDCNRGLLAASELMCRCYSEPAHTHRDSEFAHTH